MKLFYGDLDEIKQRGWTEIIVDCMKYFSFSSLYVSDWKFFMSNFFIECVKSKRIDFMVLARNHHASNSCEMQVRRAQRHRGFLEEIIHVLHWKEECLVWTPIASCYFNHPVDHLSSVLCGYCVGAQKFRWDSLALLEEKKIMKNLDIFIYEYCKTGFKNTFSVFNITLFGWIVLVNR